MSSLFLNPDLFFLIEDGQILAWDYKKHNQYLLDEEYFSELLEISRSGKQKNEKSFPIRALGFPPGGVGIP